MKSALPTLVCVRDRNLTSWRAGPSTLVVPQECCTGQDCAPVEKVTWLVPTGGGLPQLVVTSTLGAAVVPTTCLRRESKDGRMHVCIQDISGGLPLHPATNVANEMTIHGVKPLLQRIAAGDSPSSQRKPICSGNDDRRACNASTDGCLFDGSAGTR